MNQIKTNITGGFPLTLNDLGFIQQSTLTALKGILSAYGVNEQNAVILSGCERTVGGGNITVAEGYVSIGGEVCYFPEQVYPNPGLGIKEYFNIVSSYDPEGNKVFQDGNSNDTYEVRIAQIATAATVPNTHTEYSLTPTIYQLIDQNTDSVPIGAIIMWSGALVDVPTGYALCDGQNGTPDLRGRFVVGYNPNDSDYDTIGETGGEKKHSLTVNEMPSHQHTMPIANTTTNVSDPSAVIISSAVMGNHHYDPIDVEGSTGATGSSSGAGSAHENRPPYYTIAFIMKIDTLVGAANPWANSGSSS